MVAATDLPDDCWRHVFKFLGDDDDHSRILKSLSVVSKEFLSITSRLRYSLIIGYRAPSNLRPEFQRFTNLTSINLQGYPHNLNNVLHQLSCFPLYLLRSLNLSCHKTIPIIGLQAFSKKITTLTSLVCSGIRSIDITDMFFIVDCFPLLKELDLSYPGKIKRKCTNIETFSLPLLSKLRKVNLSGHYYMNDNLIFHLFKNCMFLEETIVFDCDQITIVGIASALRKRPKLRSLSFSDMFDFEPKPYAMLFASIVEFTVEFKYMMERKKSVEFNYKRKEKKSVEFNYKRKEKKSVEFNYKRKEKKSVDFVLKNKLKSLHLECNTRWLTDENGFGEGIYQILKICRKIRHLNLAYCSVANLRGMNFKLPKLEVMNLSHTKVDDEALSVISKSCCGLLQLILECCCRVTESGVKHVMENCTQLQEINLRGCNKVDPSVVALMVISRPSLRKIIAPPRCHHISDLERELYLPSYLTLIIEV